MRLQKEQQPESRPFSMEQLERDLGRSQHPVLVRQERAEDYAPPAVREQIEVCRQGQRRMGLSRHQAPRGCDGA